MQLAQAAQHNLKTKARKRAHSAKSTTQLKEEYTNYNYVAGH